ncbi:hypothetical protein ABB55_03225 [Prosthecomicrobium hirschii]|uniref:Uncharacterized protein n=1 Tax=Prosthecodimorpha hirschii TaxID=665126 RepID=A0A0P6VH49_9HYPH|nr:hypothetical protein [Prosthecomicrobium hirschii]KPL51358.1 hypothetical protein ABB55_03225 [Prosthecomicrobium hirschii]
MVTIGGRRFTSARHAAITAGLDPVEFVGLMNLEPSCGLHWPPSWESSGDEVAVAVDRLGDLFAAAGVPEHRVRAVIDQIIASSPPTPWRGTPVTLDQTPPVRKRRDAFLRERSEDETFTHHPEKAAGPREASRGIGLATFAVVGKIL